ncbi:hypothetical protein BB559_000822 [Furculomyces boomerangus]|uniref:Uncharacterized protein n=1 Tax=Furculomyces boomerangus TaxID=61424 RepID=A0A2T9Z3Y3_9FUNG|nr:hypothetical protein BB559_000822 [Furculomyces boomerangus]
MNNMDILDYISDSDDCYSFDKEEFDEDSVETQENVEDKTRSNNNSSINNSLNITSIIKSFKTFISDSLVEEISRLTVNQEVASSSLSGSVWSYGLTVMTLDSESSSPSSTLGKTSSPVSSMVEREAFNLKRWAALVSVASPDALVVAVTGANEVASSSLSGSVWSYGLTVMTLDSESSSPSSTLGKTSSPVSSMVEREAFNLKRWAALVSVASPDALVVAVTGANVAMFNLTYFNIFRVLE